jgi:ABC-type nickel/cobalt efflux system permease component RcnA
MLQSPPDQRQAVFTIGALPAAGRDQMMQPASAVAATMPNARNDRFTQLITLEQPDFATLLAALAVAFGWGAMHALTPGHGKTIVATYLVGSRGTSRHALFLGLTTTVTHTLGVFALGLVTLFASQHMMPELLYPWLEVISGLLVVALGVSLFGRRLVRFVGHRKELHGHADHTHGSPENEHDHVHGSHSHDHAHMEHEHHDHDHMHGHAHNHLPPGADGTPVTWRSLLALGISGGLLPCPSALVVMLGAIALGRVGLGLALIVAFSLGLATVLTAIGVLFVHAGRLFERFGRAPIQGRLLGAAPVLSALVITVVGLAITGRALAQLAL